MALTMYIANLSHATMQLKRVRFVSGVLLDTVYYLEGGHAAAVHCLFRRGWATPPQHRDQEMADVWISHSRTEISRLVIVTPRELLLAVSTELASMTLTPAYRRFITLRQVQVSPQITCHLTTDQ